MTCANLVLYATLVTKTALLGGGLLMADEHVVAPRTEPVRIVRMSIAPDPRLLAGGPLTIVAHLDPGPDQEELQWWIEQLRERVNVGSWSGSGAPGSTSGVTAVQVEAPDDQFEEVARQLVAAVEEANAAYPERYAAWRRERDAQVDDERRRQQRLLADHQAILDRVMDEYRSNG